MVPTAGPTLAQETRTFRTLPAAMPTKSARIRHLILRDNCTNFRALELGVSYKDEGSEKYPQNTPMARWLHADECSALQTGNSSKSAGFSSIPADRPDVCGAMQNHAAVYGW